MLKVHKIRKGFNINLAGKAEKLFGKTNPSEFYAVKPGDFHGLVPKLEVKEGSPVRAGTPLFVDKNNPLIRFTSPVSGEVVSVNRGERRVILEVIVKADGNQESESFLAGDPQAMSREEIINNLMKSGLWPSIRQRPYNIVAAPKDIPKSIFISAFDTAPLAPDYDFLIQGSESDFQVGIDALSKLTSGRVHINVSDEYPASQAFTQARNAQVNYFRGPHPAGNVSVQIQRLDPLNKGEIIWVVTPQDVIVIGRLFTKGVYDASKIIALAGSEVIHPRYYRIIGGASIKSIVDGNIGKSEHRYISGNPLTGAKVGHGGFIGYYDSQVTVLPEGNHFEFLGWALPGFSKFSFSRSFWSWLSPDRGYKMDTNLHGGHRPFVLTGLYEQVFPMDIYPMQLLKAILAEDIDQMERLGIYEVVEEDFALCEFVCPSKTEMQVLIRKGLDLMKQEMS
ncbi:MAG: Na(+)-translocating NADH-quinone reductase subunit A [Bacteroidales bacterium]|nr:Na(+)-translocating NADH-quinone reductase subunit A [Bacteroidales bacterium]